jgi:hypothetical protein
VEGADPGNGLVGGVGSQASARAVPANPVAAVANPEATTTTPAKSFNGCLSVVWSSMTARCQNHAEGRLKPTDKSLNLAVVWLCICLKTVENSAISGGGASQGRRKRGIQPRKSLRRSETRITVTRCRYSVILCFKRHSGPTGVLSGFLAVGVKTGDVLETAAVRQWEHRISCRRGRLQIAGGSVGIEPESAIAVVLSHAGERPSPTT